MEGLTDNCIPFAEFAIEYLNPQRGGLSERHLFSLLKAEIASSQMALWRRSACTGLRRPNVGSITRGSNAVPRWKRRPCPSPPTQRNWPSRRRPTSSRSLKPTRTNTPGPIRRSRASACRIASPFSTSGANTDKFADPKTITEAQIKEEYEKQKEMYDRFEAMLPEKPLTEKEEKKPEAAASPKQGKPSAEEKRPPVLQQKPAPGEKGTAKPQSKAAPAEVKKGAAGEKSAPPPQKKPAGEDKGAGKTSSAAVWSFRLVSHSEDAKPAAPKDSQTATFETTSPLPPGTASCRKQRRRRSRSPRAPKPARLRQPRRN